MGRYVLAEEEVGNVEEVELPGGVALAGDAQEQGHPASLAQGQDQLVLQACLARQRLQSPAAAIGL